MSTEEGGLVTSWRLSGLADPAISALGPLCHLVATVFTTPDDNTMDLVAMSALATMSEAAQDRLRAASVRADDMLASEACPSGASLGARPTRPRRLEGGVAGSRRHGAELAGHRCSSTTRISGRGGRRNR